MNEIGNFDVSPLRDSVTTLKETSKDDSSNEVSFMTESAYPAYDFDDAMHKYIACLPKGKRPEGVPCSVDAFVKVGNELFVMVEFKNGRLDKQTCAQVREKFFCSVLMLGDLLGWTLEYIRQHVEFILEYNEQKNKNGIPENEPRAEATNVSESRRTITSIISKKGNKHNPGKRNRSQFDILKKMKHFCARDVDECTESEFNEEYVIIWESKGSHLTD